MSLVKWKEGGKWGAIHLPWSDYQFIKDIDGIGSGAWLRQAPKEDKKRLIHLICRVRGEKVYDETKEIEDIEIKVEDIDLLIEKVLGKMRVKNTNVI